PGIEAEATPDGDAVPGLPCQGSLVPVSLHSTEHAHLHAEGAAFEIEELAVHEAVPVAILAREAALALADAAAHDGDVLEVQAAVFIHDHDGRAIRHLEIGAHPGRQRHRVAVDGAHAR